MVFVRQNPLGWAMFEVLSSAQMNGVDINGSRAIDGYAGGTYNPSAFIQINNEFIVDATSAVGVNATGITVTGKGTGNGIVSFGGVDGRGGIFYGYATKEGVRGIGGATGGTGLSGKGGATDGTGVTGEGGATNGIGVSGQGTGKGYGGNFNAGAGVPAVAGDCCGLMGVGGSANAGILQACAGVFGVGGAPNGGCGVIGQAGLGNFYGVLGLAGSGAAGVTGDGESVGIGVIATGGSAAGPAFHIEPQAAHPGSPLSGDMWVRGNILYVCLVDGVTKTVTVS